MLSRSEELIRRLSRRYAAVLAIVAGLLLIDQAVLQPMLLQLSSSAPVINLAGRQRMLSQQIVKDALTIALDPETVPRLHEPLSQTLDLWRSVQAGLLQGDASLELEPARDPVIVQSLREIDEEIAALTALVHRILAEPATAREAVPELLSIEQRFLPAMDEVVELYERDAQAQIRRLRWTAISGTIVVIALMTGLYWLVLSPAIRMIRQQVGELHRHEQELLAAQNLLEARVTQRTSQLSESLPSLEQAALERAAAEQRARQLQDQLARAARINSLGELATGIAHEINQPLGAIANDAETLLILSEQTSPDRVLLARVSRRLREAAQRAGLIVRRMRNFLRARSQPLSLQPLNPLIAEVLALCEPELRQREIEVAVQTDDTESLQLLVDSIQFQQVLVNLINNAAQALESRPDGHSRISISTSRDAEAATICVDDNGPGFAVSPGPMPVPLQSTKPDGLGLGLSISRSIIEAHGGTLTLQNIDSGGARVVVSLPFSTTTPPLEHADRLCR